MHSYNETYFSALDDFVTKAQAKQIHVMLSLFDFSEDIPWSDDAWNPGNNDHSGLSGFTATLSSDKNAMLNIWDASGNLNHLGITQRDYVLKVVREMRHHKNVIFEIANEPKDTDADEVIEWTRQIAEWIRDGHANSTCDGAPDHLRATTNPFEPGDRTYFLQNINPPQPTPQFVNMYSEHNAYLGSLTGSYAGDSYIPYRTPIPTPTPGVPTPTPRLPYTREEWETVNLTLNRESSKILEDQDSTNYSMVLLCDTDGLHRRMPGSIGNSTPFGRDFDANCKRFANIAFINRVQFNTKEQLHWDSGGALEVDCKTNGTELISNDDDFLDENNWHNFDTTLGDAVCGLSDFTPVYNPATSTSHEALNYRHLTRLAGFYPPKVAVSPGELPQTTMISKIGWMNNNRMPDELSAAVGFCPIDPSTYYFASLGDLPWSSTLPGLNDYLLNPEPDPAKTPTSSYYGDVVTGFSQTHGDTFIMTSPVYGNVSAPSELVYSSGACLSDPWPMLFSATDHINMDSNLFTVGTIVQSGGLPTAISGITQPGVVQVKQNFINSRFQRISCFDPPSSGPESEQPIIVAAGWGSSNLHDKCPGFFEIELIIFSPTASISGTNIQNAQFELLKIRNSGESTWYKVFDFGNTLTTDYFTTVEFEGGLLMTTKLVIPLNRPVASGFHLLELALFTATGSVEISNVWPRMEVNLLSPICFYLDTRIEKDNVGNGSISDPFSSFNYALSQIKKKGSLSQPIEIRLVQGTHHVDVSNSIILEDYMNLSGEENAVIEYESGVSAGYYVQMGRHSRITDLTLRCSVQCEHSHTRIKNCIFEDIEDSAAIKLCGFHDLIVENCIFEGCTTGAFAEDNSVLNVLDSNFVNSESGISLTDEAFGQIKNSIFHKISNTLPGQDGIGIKATENSEALVKYCAFFQNDQDYDNNCTGPFNLSHCVFGSDPGVPDDPKFVDWTIGDYHLVQSNVRNSIEGASPCVDTGEHRHFQKGTTSKLGERDSGQYDIGYHYPETNFEYVFPRFKAEDGTTTDYTTEIAIFNPTEYTQTLLLTCRNMAGTIQDFNGTSDGNVLEVELGSGETWFKVLSDSCSPSDDECMESPCDDGSIEVESDGPLFGQYRIVEDDTSRGKNAWMLPMQRVDLMEDEGDAVSLANDSWTGNFGGGSNSTVTELVLRNLDDGSNTITGTVYNNQGTPVPSESFTESLAVGETEIVMFDGMSMMDYSNMEFYADGPVVGEVIFHCQNHNVTGGNNFSHGEILHPSSNYSDVLTAPYVQLINSGSYYQESYVCLKNPGTTGITAYVNVIDEDGDSIFKGSPTPTPISIPAHGSDCISSYDFPDWGTYSVEIDIADGKEVIGHQEIMSYESSETDFGFAGCQLDHHIESPTRFFVPMCTLKDSPEETTWVALRNNNSASVSIDLEILDLEGNSLDDTTVTLGALEILLFTFGDSPALLDPDTEERFSLVIESTGNLSGWVEQYGINTAGDDQTYDANLLHSW